MCDWYVKPTARRPCTARRSHSFNRELVMGYQKMIYCHTQSTLHTHVLFLNTRFVLWFFYYSIFRAVEFTLLLCGVRILVRDFSNTVQSGQGEFGRQKEPSVLVWLHIPPSQRFVNLAHKRVHLGNKYNCKQLTLKIIILPIQNLWSAIFKVK
jgi:hypothetical protein